MMGGKKTFLLHKSDIFLTETLSKEQLGELFAMMLQWQNCDESERASIQSADALVNGFFAMFANRFASDESEYKRVCAVRRENGRRGGVANATKSKQMQPKESKTSKSIPILSSPDNNNIISTDSRKEVQPSNTDNNTDSGIDRQRASAPVANWRHLSSATLDFLKKSGQDVAEYKKSLLRQEVAALGILTDEGVDAFVNKWGEHNPNSDIIAAEMEHIFDVASRARNYVKRFGKPVGQPEAADSGRFEDGKSYWLRSFTKEDLYAMSFEVRQHVQRGGAAKRMNGKWVKD